MSARDIAVEAALALAAANGLVGLFGVVLWYRATPSRSFWLGLRAGQVGALLYAVLVGALYIEHHRPGSSLFYLYALLPLAIGFVAEQLRAISAEQVLSAREIEDSARVAELAREEQQEIVLAILRREMGVMALAALVVCFLALRAAGTY
jgi:hypothetical protein